MAANNGVAKEGGLIVSFGEMLIDFVPTVSGVSLAEAPGFLKAPGGAPANVAIAVSRLGGKSAFVGKLGDDEFGHMLAGILKENGVSGEGINFDKGARTALAFKSVHLHVVLYNCAKVFHYGSISLIVEPCRSAHLKAMEVAKDAGALLSYDPNLRLPLWPSPEEAREQIMSIWDKAEVIKLLLVTLGDKGCNYYTKHFHGTIGAFAVKAVDTTGAGDSFVGALLTKLVDDHSVLEDEGKLRELLRFSCACGAITTTKKGAIPALPSVSEVHTFLDASHN
ncbi:unnamed protein product [Lactuca saligna]|uniref:Carbohydrate kinase PfkB domain-containing protein n=1 Tax=Lactuca saligna TaxID=75948 RepID=A0AA35Y8D9_LACSI|nr:unnamed protein product [Lactuca saligna]